jgi:2-polyprenyl-6-hydroxyphenyl methylase / 3-demethylubiquinone-9 3-methyltransferase
MTSTRSFKKFYEQVGERYPEEDQVYRTLRGLLRKKFVLSAIHQWQGSLLDVGCNRGMYLKAFTGGARFGIDVSLNVLRRAGRDESLHLAVADAERLECFAPESFDHVLCSEVMEHCLHPDRIFDGIALVLKHGGTALFTTPNYKKKRPQWIAMGSLTHYGIDSVSGDTYYHSAFRPEELRRMALNAGLSPIETGTLEKDIKYAAKVPAALLLMVRLANRLIHSRHLDRWNERMNNTFTLLIYYFCRTTGLDRLLLLFVKEGVRSYIIVQKENPRNGNASP